MSATFALYRFYAADESLLYVGRTINPGRRMERHRTTKPWWNTIARITIEHHVDFESLRVAERDAIRAEKPLHNIRMNGSNGTHLSGGSTHPPEREIDGLVGRFFHSWRPAQDNDKYATIRNGNVLEWQGHIVDQVAVDVYLAELFSWWDGCPSDQRLVRLDEMSLWTFYDSALEMQCGTGCPESDPDRCGQPITHFFDNRKHGLGLLLLCSSCVKRYPGFRDATPLQWDANGKPMLP